MYKVFFNERVIFIGSDFKNYRLDNKLFFQVSSPKEAEIAWKSILDDKSERDIIILPDQPLNSMDLFRGLFTIIDAAGGIVTNKKNQLLCISRWGKWDLPKGKKEKGEKTEETAIREVEEECGISGLENKGFNSITYHIYEHPRKPGYWILKQTYWYNMIYLGDEQLIPQTQEEITDARWFDKSEMDVVIENTWSSLKPIFKAFISSE